MKDLKFGKHDELSKENNENLGFFKKKLTSKQNKALPENSHQSKANLSEIEDAKSQSATPLVTPSSLNETQIASDTCFTGEINADNDVKISGHFKGTLKCSKRLFVSGHLLGNVNSGSVTLNGGAVEGDLSIKEDLSLDVKAIIIGNVTCKNAKVDGRVKGDIIAEGTVSISENAIIHGNITASNIITQKGSIINGHITIICQKSEKEIFALSSSEDAQPKPNKQQ